MFVISDSLPIFFSEVVPGTSLEYELTIADHVQPATSRAFESTTE
jgi:hypothetical protein